EAGAEPSRAHDAAQAAVASVAASRARTDSGPVRHGAPSSDQSGLQTTPPPARYDDSGYFLDDEEPSRRVGAVLIVLILVAGAIGAAIWSGLDGDPEPGRLAGITR